METFNFAGLGFGALAIAAVGYFVIKGYNAKGVLLTVGVFLLIAAGFLGHSPIKEPSGMFFVDISDYIYTLMEKRGGGLGLLIMTLIGFSVYMSHIGANDAVVRILYKPLHKVRSPYILMIGGFIIGSLMSFAISSATALGVFLMATLFPVMVGLGISVPSAAAVCATTLIVNLSPASAEVIASAENAKVLLTDFVFKTAVPMGLFVVICVAVAHFFWQRYCDKKEGLVITAADGEVVPADPMAHLSDAPWYYSLLPFLPIVGLLVFTGKEIHLGSFAFTLPAMSLGSLVVLTLIIAAVIEFIRKRSAEVVYTGLEKCYEGMAEAFSAVVMLLVAAGVFAEGLSQVGFVSALIDATRQMDGASLVMMLTMVFLTLLIAIASGSGSAAFFAFVEIAPRLADHLGINPVYLIAPMMQASSTGRAMSPVAGVIVAVSGSAKISPMLLVKRTSVPMLVATAAIIAYTLVAIPLHTA
ncbi:anaerobic C4-dicarboxylate transporter DcuC [Pasteurellaceae bacterium TAE3-ERU1]|nr:anaerobic C4-dicarboxylate transporter DcuC [Pasteurellaceae bacterium TAE3-ERU1]